MNTKYTGQGRVAQKNNTESMSNIHNKLNTCISSKCKSLYQQLLALIIVYLRPNKLTLMILVGARTTFSSRTNFFFFQQKFKTKFKK